MKSIFSKFIFSDVDVEALAMDFTLKSFVKIKDDKDRAHVFKILKNLISGSSLKSDDHDQKSQEQKSGLNSFFGFEFRIIFLYWC